MYLKGEEKLNEVVDDLRKAYGVAPDKEMKILLFANTVISMSEI